MELRAYICRFGTSRDNGLPPVRYLNMLNLYHSDRELGSSAHLVTSMMVLRIRHPSRFASKTPGSQHAASLLEKTFCTTYDVNKLINGLFLRQVPFSCVNTCTPSPMSLRYSF